MGRAIRVLLGAMTLLGTIGPFTALAADPKAPFRAADPEIIAERAVPQACFTFPEKLSRSGNIPMDSFVQVQPAATLAASVRDNRLCLEGFAHGRSYRVTLRQGLPGVGQKLERAQSFDIRVPDREPSIAFASRGNILPRVGSEGLPLRTVNVSRVQVQIVRVNDRTLIESIRGSNIGDTLSLYTLKMLRQNRGEPVWEGTLDVESERNKPSITALPLGSTIGQLQPGVYVALATQPGLDEEKVWWQDQATQWFVVSDLGLTTFMGADGLTAHVRSLDSTAPVGGVELTLIARNNKELGRIVTNRDGFARFDAGLIRGKGGNAPTALYATAAGGDFVFLNIGAPGLDLTDRGVKGRVAAGPLEVFLYTERGIYRPGETVHLTGLLRDERANASPGLPITLKLLRPDGVEADRKTLADQGAGSYRLSFDLAPTAYTGHWTAQAFTDIKGDPIGSIDFQVEDFVPPRIEFDLTADSDPFTVGETHTLRIAARYLYGAPGADLKGEIATLVRVAESPFPQHAGYSFGLTEEEAPNPVQIDPVELRTDEDGDAEAEIIIESLPDTSRPLEAEIRATIFDVGGRPVQREITVPIAKGGFFIGIRPRFTGSVPQNSAAGFEVISVGPDGVLQDRRALSWELLEEQYDYSWYRNGGSWDYRRTVRDRRIAGGSVDALKSGPARLEAQITASGQYRLEVFDQQSGAATSVRFASGWWGSTGEEDDKPDQVSVVAARASAGAASASVTIKPPFEAEVLVTVVDRRVRTAFSRRIPAEGATIDIPIEPDWTGGVYVVATAFAQADKAQSHLPRRAIGLAWIPADLPARTLNVAVDAPEKIRPQQSITVPVTLASAVPGEDAFVTLAAVDDAVLQLTDYKAPDPNEFYLGQRGLQVTIRDIYGKLIDPMGAKAGRVRSGGDGDGSRQLANLPQKTSKVLSLYSGILKVDAGGRINVPLDIPDFNGRVRLMAVAWTATKLGHAETTMIVRPPVIAELALPRFMAPGDIADLTLSLHNVEGPAGAYRVQLSTEGPFEIRGGNIVEAQLLAEGRQRQPVMLHSPTAGDGKIRLALSGPGDVNIAREWTISSRPGNPTVTRRTVGVLNPGQQLAFEAGPLTAGMIPETASVSLALSSAPELNIAAILQQLDRFPYGCAEQTTSRALPLLYVADLADALQLGGKKLDPRTIPAAITRVLSMQTASGGFGLWSAASEDDPWLSAYVTDFLTRAREKGHEVPGAAFDKALAYLSSYSQEVTSRTLVTQAYAHYVLARAQRIDPSRLRYFANTYQQQFPTAVARAQVAAALALVGDRAAAEQAFAGIETAMIRRNVSTYDYGSPLRDQAAVTALMAESRAGTPERLLTLADGLSAQIRQRQYFSTQEQAWILMAADGLMNGARPMRLEVDGRDRPGPRPYVTSVAAGQTARPVTLRNAGDGVLTRTITVTGVPIDPEPADASGFTLRRLVFDRAGNPANPVSVKQSELLVVVLEGRFNEAGLARSIVVDMLPAGWEIENASLMGAGDVSEFEWLGELTEIDHAEYRDDRFVAALDLNRDTKKTNFRVAYLVRAVTPGDFTLPGTYVEDMYRPYLFARTSTGRIVVRPD